MKKKFVGSAPVSGCGMRSVETLCVEAENQESAVKLMERILRGRFPSYGDLTDFHEATEDESRTLPIDRV